LTGAIKPDLRRKSGFCLPGEAGKPGHLKEGGVTLT